MLMNSILEGALVVPGTVVGNHYFFQIFIEFGMLKLSVCVCVCVFVCVKFLNKQTNFHQAVCSQDKGKYLI